MQGSLTIGDFARAVRLSAKALRHYHRVGLLAPAVVDPRTGYRLYSPAQIADAQVVRTLRGLDVPVDAIREVLLAVSVEERAVLITEHLRRMEARLDETRSAVLSLRALLEEPETPVEIAHRSVPALRVLAVEAVLTPPELGDWFRATVGLLTEAADRATAGAVGPVGGVWSTELFEEERGSAMLHLPLHDGFDERALDPRAIDPRARILELPPVEVAAAIHVGSDETVPRTYAALGEHVARHELRVAGPVRETYLSGFPGIDEHLELEIAWPIFRVSR